MKLLFIAPLNSIHSTRWIKFFANRTHEVHVVDVGLGERQALPGATVHTLVRREEPRSILQEYFQRYLPTKREIGRIVDRVQPDLVHVQGVSIYAYLVHRYGFHPIVVTAWGSEVLIDTQRSLKYRTIVKRVLRTCDVVTCDAEHMGKTLVELGAPAERVRLIYFGTDVTEFTPAKRKPDVWQKLGFPPGTPVVISLRALKPVYDVDTLIRASRSVLGRRPEVGFVVVGDGSERGRLERLATELGVAERVRFVGRLSDEDLQTYTACADVYVSTSTSDAGLASSTAEAMASGVPVVITGFGNNSEWVKQDESGFLFQIGDAEALADHVVGLMERPQDRQRMGAAGRAIIEKRNNWHTQMEGVEQMYAEVASSH